MIRVVIVDDQALIRRGLRTLFSIEDDLDLVGEAADAEGGLELLRRARPDVALVDARMPGRTGIELIGDVTAELPQVACLLLTTFDDDEYLYGALRAGARGHLLKDADPERIVSAVRELARGETVLGSAAAERLVRDVRTGPGAPPRQAVAAPLSARELQVAELVAAGASNREIARRLYLTEGTVKNHVSGALRKLGLRDRTQLAIHVIQD